MVSLKALPSFLFAFHCRIFWPRDSLATNSRPFSRQTTKRGLHTSLLFPELDHFPDLWKARKKSTDPKALSPQNQYFMLPGGECVHRQGLEPWTPWLRVRCSTNWASGAYACSATQRLLYYIIPTNASIFFIKILFFVSVLSKDELLQFFGVF